MGLTLNVIRERDEFCKPCGLYKVCETPVMNGEGSENPVWLFIGEAPGGEEDEKGYPFAGESGLLLRDAIEELGIPAKDCRFSNAVRCRPPKNNLKAWPNAIKQCRPHILREIRAVRPKVVVLLGNSAIQSLLNKRGIMALHGEVIDIGLWKYVCCFHPSYLLRNNTPAVNKKFRDALQIAKDLGMPKKIRKSEERKHVIVQDKKTLYEYHDMLMKQKYLATDIEGSTLNAFSRLRTPKLGMVGWAWDERHAVCYPIHGNFDLKVRVKQEEFLDSMKEIWENENIRHILHHGKYDFVYAAVLNDIWLGGKNGFGYYADTLQMDYCLDEKPGNRGLKEWAYKIGMGGYEQPFTQYKMVHPEAAKNYLKAPISILGPYNMDDCIATWRLFWLLRHRLKKQNLWDRPFKFPQMWHNWTAAIMEINGLTIDANRNAELQEIFQKRIRKVEDSIYEHPEIAKLQRIEDRKLMGKLYERVTSYKKPVPSISKKVIELFNQIPKEKREVKLTPDTKRTLVFDILNYKPLWYTKSKENPLPSVEREVLEKLCNYKPHKLLRKLIKQGALASAESKYVTPVPEWIGVDGKTHTTYKPQGQLTGRVSSEDPNHENLPKHGPLAMELRSQFVSSGEDYFILEEDSKQIEMRLFADRAQDDRMIQEFADGKDPHAMGAMAGFEISEEKWNALEDNVRKELRSAAKSAVSFGLLYGRAAKALAKDFGKSVEWAEKFIARYFGKYDDCLEYRLKRERYIRKHKIVYSYFFRPRRLPLVDSDNDAVSAEAIRQGINAPIQGDASDITWVALHRLAHWLQKYKMKSKTIIAVHDAGYVDTYYKEMQDVMEKLHHYMTDRNFIKKMTGWYCSVPFDTDASVGLNLGNMVELKHGNQPGEFILPSEFR